MLLIIWLSIGAALNLITITRTCNKYYNYDIPCLLPIAFYTNFALAPFILLYNLFLIATVKSSLIVKSDIKI